MPFAPVLHHSLDQLFVVFPQTIVLAFFESILYNTTNLLPYFTSNVWPKAANFQFE